MFDGDGKVGAFIGPRRFCLTDRRVQGHAASLDEAKAALPNGRAEALEIVSDSVEVEGDDPPNALADAPESTLAE